MSKYAEYGVEYQMDGQAWIIHVDATSEDDAMRRLYHAALGNPLGRLMFTVRYGWLAKIVGWWKGVEA